MSMTMCLTYLHGALKAACPEPALNHQTAIIGLTSSSPARLLRLALNHQTAIITKVKCLLMLRLRLALNHQTAIMMCSSVY